MINFRINRAKKQSGFIMIQVLLGLAILITIMTSWAYYQNRVHQRAIATRITNEINYILEASTAYYKDHNGIWPVDVGALVDGGYLQAQTDGKREILNPYGQPYQIIVPLSHHNTSDDNPTGGGFDAKLYLMTYIPKDYAYVSRNAMTALPFAKLNPPIWEPKIPMGYDMLEVAVMPYGSGLVKNVRIVTSGTIITKPKATAYQEPAIYTSVSACADLDKYSIGGVRTYARNYDKDHWQVFMEVLTNAGWKVVNQDPFYHDHDLDRIEVVTTCQSTDTQP